MGCRNLACLSRAKSIVGYALRGRVDGRDDGLFQTQIAPADASEEAPLVESHAAASSVPPRCVAGALAPFRAQANNTLRGAIWSPDGLCLLTASEDKRLRLFELPENLQSEEGLAALDDEAESDASAEPAQQPELPNPLTVLEGDAVYDYTWFPGMDSSQPETCCFLSSSRDHPIRLWDAYTGTCRASYVAYNHLDDVTVTLRDCLDEAAGMAGVTMKMKVTKSTLSERRSSLSFSLTYVTTHSLSL